MPRRHALSLAEDVPCSRPFKLSQRKWEPQRRSHVHAQLKFAHHCAAAYEHSLVGVGSVF